MTGVIKTPALWILEPDVIVNVFNVGRVNPPFAVIKSVEFNTPELFIDEHVKPFDVIFWKVFE